jgi:hypothetical protein
MPRETRDEQWDYVVEACKIFGGDLNATMRRAYFFEFAAKKGVDLATCSDDVIYELVNAAKIDAMMGGRFNR